MENIENSSKNAHTNQKTNKKPKRITTRTKMKHNSNLITTTCNKNLQKARRREVGQNPQPSGTFQDDLHPGSNT